MLRMAFGSNAYVNLEYTNKRTGEKLSLLFMYVIFLTQWKIALQQPNL